MRFSTQLLYYYLFAISKEGNCISIARHPNGERLANVHADSVFTLYLSSISYETYYHSYPLYRGAHARRLLRRILRVAARSPFSAKTATDADARRSGSRRC